MTIKEIIAGLKFTVGMFLLDPSTGETYTEPRNDMDKTTIDACNGAIEVLEQTRWIPITEGLPKKTGWYFVTFKTFNGVGVCEASYRKPENYWTDKNISKKLFDNEEILAWMHLPKSFKAEREVDNE